MRRLAAPTLLALLIASLLVPIVPRPASAQAEPTPAPLVDPCSDAAGWWAGTAVRWNEADAILADLEKEVAKGEAGPEDYAAVANRLGTLSAEQRASVAPEAGEELHGVVIQLLDISRLAVLAEGVVAFPDGQPASVVQGALAQLTIFADQLASLRPRGEGLTDAFLRECGVATA